MGLMKLLSTEKPSVRQKIVDRNRKLLEDRADKKSPKRWKIKRQTKPSSDTA